MFNRQKPKKNKFEKLTMMNCGTCPRQIVVEHEPNGKVFYKDGKPMCMICRAVKLSSHRSEIESSKPQMEQDLKQVNEQFEREESERLIHVAAEAQARAEAVEKNLKA